MDVTSIAGLAAVAGGIGGSLTMLALRTYVSERVKQSIKSEYDAKLEVHKAQLASRTAIEVEKLKSELGRAAAEQQFRFSKLHEQRAQVVAKLYELLKWSHLAMRRYVSLGQFGSANEAERRSEDDDRRQQAANKLQALDDYFLINAIFIPRQTEEHVEELLNTYRQSYFAFLFHVQQGNDQGNRTQKWLEISHKVESLTKEALYELDQEFRHLLGDDVSSHPTLRAPEPAVKSN